jgi:epothilone synthetase B
MTLTTIIRQLVTKNIKLWVEGEQLRVQAPKDVMTPALRKLISENKGELLAWLQAHEQGTAYTLPQVVPQPAARYQPFPLTDMYPPTATLN